MLESKYLDVWVRRVLDNWIYIFCEQLFWEFYWWSNKDNLIIFSKGNFLFQSSIFRQTKITGTPTGIKCLK